MDIVKKPDTQFTENESVFNVTGKIDFTLEINKTEMNISYSSSKESVCCAFNEILSQVKSLQAFAQKRNEKGEFEQTRTFRDKVDHTVEILEKLTNEQMKIVYETHVIQHNELNKTPKPEAKPAKKKIPKK